MAGGARGGAAGATAAAAARATVDARTRADLAHLGHLAGVVRAVAGGYGCFTMGNGYLVSISYCKGAMLAREEGPHLDPDLRMRLLGRALALLRRRAC